MKHIIFGGDGFVGRYIARDLLAAGHQVLLCDRNRSDLPVYRFADYLPVDVRDAAAVATVPIAADDIVYNMAARLLMPPVKKSLRYQAYFPVHVDGTRNILTHMYAAGANHLVQFSTDMVYGPSVTPPPIRTDHPRNPIDAYGKSKLACEDLCREWRQRGMQISLFRPRMVMGPGRLGLLQNLFRLIEANLPVPTIGSGSNRYQFVSVFDCASFAIQAAQMGCPNGEWNLGSVGAPSVRELLKGLVRHAGSRSLVIPTPAFAVKAVLATLDKVGLTLLTRAQYAIADEDYVVDVEDLRAVYGRVPEGTDEQMLTAAFDEYRRNRDPNQLANVFTADSAWAAFTASRARV